MSTQRARTTNRASNSSVSSGRCAPVRFFLSYYDLMLTCAVEWVSLAMSMSTMHSIRSRSRVGTSKGKTARSPTLSTHKRGITLCNRIGARVAKLPLLCCLLQYAFMTASRWLVLGPILQSRMSFGVFELLRDHSRSIYALLTILTVQVSMG